MTVARLQERMDQRFKAVDKRFEAIDKRFESVDQRLGQMTIRMDAGFRSLHDKLNAIVHILDNKNQHHFKIIDEHDERLNDLETWRRASSHPAR